METRKIQQVGGGTYTVSIPVEWADEHGLTAGGTAYLYTHRDGSLVVRWGEIEERALGATVVDLADSDGQATSRLLMAAYTAGFERITLRRRGGLTDSQRRAARDGVRELTGVEITDEADDHITVRGLLSATDVSIRQSVLQLQFIALSMHDAAVAVFAGERAEPEYVVTRDDEADRVFRLVERHLNRSLLLLRELDDLGIDRVRLFEYYWTARHLERIADHAAKIARTVDCVEYTVPEAFDAEVRAMSDAAQDVVEDAADVVINGGPRETVESAFERCVAVAEEGRRLEAQIIDESPEGAAVLVRLLDSIVRTAEYGGNIAELGFRRAARE